MISSQIIKASIEELSAISKVFLAVWDPEGKEIAATFETDDISPSLISGFVESPAESQVRGIEHLLKDVEGGGGGAGPGREGGAGEEAGGRPVRPRPGFLAFRKNFVRSGNPAHSGPGA